MTFRILLYGFVPPVAFTSERWPGGDIGLSVFWLH